MVLEDVTRSQRLSLRFRPPLFLGRIILIERQVQLQHVHLRLAQQSEVPILGALRDQLLDLRLRHAWGAIAKQCYVFPSVATKRCRVLTPCGQRSCPSYYGYQKPDPQFRIPNPLADEMSGGFGSAAVTSLEEGINRLSGSVNAWCPYDFLAGDHQPPSFPPNHHTRPIVAVFCSFLRRPSMSVRK
jgi:hypothetical protein